jgi:hypothetical protein
MTTSMDKSEPANNLHAFLIGIAWIVTLLVSSLGDILWHELFGAVPMWLLWGKVFLLGALILLSFLWNPIKALRPFFVMLAAITSLMRANTWLQDLPAWIIWQNKQTFTIAASSIQLLEMGVALLLVSILFLLRKRRQRFFLVIGDISAKTEPVKWLGQKSPGPLWRFGLVFTLVVIVIQIFLFILPLSPGPDKLKNLIPFIPVILLLAVSNGFNEEIILRAAPISTVYEVVGKSNAIFMAAALFGLSHYIGGIPSGISGVVTTTFLGWFFGKCMIDSRGFLWPWLLHSLQDILPFTLMALATAS